MWAEKGVPKRVDRKHNWAEKDRAENKSGPKRDLPLLKGRKRLQYGTVRDSWLPGNSSKPLMMKGVYNC